MKPKRLTAMLLTALIVLCSVPITAFAAEIGPKPVGYKIVQYGSYANTNVKLLEKYVDIDKFKDHLAKQFINCEKDIDFNQYKIPYNKNTQIAIVYLICNEIPELFHLEINDSIWIYPDSAGTYTTKITVTYRYTKSQYETMYNKCMAKVDEMLFDIKDNKNLNDVQKALLLHDRIAVDCEYDQGYVVSGKEGIHYDSYTMYGVLGKGVAVCQGYSEAYLYLLDKVGIESEVCVSDDLWHAWNIVYIGGKPYYVDVTWDDPLSQKLQKDIEGQVLHNNFLISHSALYYGVNGSSGHNAMDYTVIQSDGKYDNYFWQKSNTAFQLVGNEMYYIDNTDAKLRRYSNQSDVYDVSDTWYYEGNSYWPGNFSKLAGDGTNIYFNMAKKVYRYYPYNNTVYEVQVTTPIYNNESICGFAYKNNCFVFELSNDPYYSRSTPREETIEVHHYTNDCDTTCNKCGATRIIKHTYTNSCDTVCNVCDELREITHDFENNCDIDCNVCGETRSITHNYEWIIDKENNCGIDGIKHEECTICHATQSENTIISATGEHTYDNDCDAECNVCFQIRTVPNHIYDNSCDTICNVCNAQREITHNFEWIVDKENNCGIDGIKHEECIVCHATQSENTIIPATGNHTYDNDCDKVCNICEEIRLTDEHKYSWVIDQKENCGINGIKHGECSICGIKQYENTIIPATGNHTYSNDCDKTCNVCGKTRTVPAHKYTNKCDTSCNVCKATRKITHSYKTTITKATSAKNGKIIKKCSVCGKIASTTVIKYAKTVKLLTDVYTFNGKVITPTVIVKDYSGKTISSSNYTIKYATDRKNAGTYKVTVTFKGNYNGTKTLTFKINPQNISKCKFTLSATSYTYNGKVKTPVLTVKSATGSKLTKNTNYTVTYASGRKNVGTYKISIKGKGNYTGTQTLTFKINPKAASVNTLTAGSKRLTVKLNRSLQQSTGYQIQYSTSKTFKNAKTKTITNYKTSITSLTGLKAKTTYYVRVRTYKTISKTNYYSNWSTIKYAKTK